MVTVSESTANSVRVSWGPVQPDSVQSVQVEYSALPTGKLQIAKVNKQQNSTVLRNLQPDTQYLVTVSAKHASGSERAMSVKVCTQEGTQEECLGYMTYSSMRNMGWEAKFLSRNGFNLHHAFILFLFASLSLLSLSLSVMHSLSRSVASPCGFAAHHSGK